MAKPAYLAQPTVQRLPVILDDLAQGTLLIPNFQRPFVWKDEQRLTLLDSIRKGMPIGSLLVWRTKEHRLETYRKLGSFKLPEAGNHEVYSYLLDGHQRLSTLYGALHELSEEEENEADEEDPEDASTRWPIFYDLRSEEFTLTARSGEPPVTWLPMSRIFNPEALYEYQKKLIDEGHKLLSRKAENLANIFKDYQIPSVPIVTEDLKQVTESFQRINSQGTRMSEVHMVNALMWRPDFDLNKRLEAITEQLAPVGWGTIDPQSLLDTIKLSQGVDIYTAAPQEVEDAIKTNPNLLTELPTHVEHATNFLRTCWVNGPEILPYRYQLAILAEAARLHGGPLEGAVEESLREWFWLTTYTEYFTGMSSTQLRHAVEHVRAIVEEGADAKPRDLPREVRPVLRFNFNAVRTRAMVLLLLQLNPRGPDGAPMAADDLVAESGVDAVPKIISAQRLEAASSAAAPENRWIVAPTKSRALFKAVMDPATPHWKQLLASHAISENAFRRLENRDYTDFLAARRKHLLALEKEIVRNLGLSYVDRGAGA
jgi:Protein of unknown function DUF262